jgi:hypothetical protein
MKQFIIFALLLLLSCTNSDRKYYKLLSKHEWFLNKIELDSIQLKSFPILFSGKTCMHWYYFTKKTPEEIVYNSFKKDFQDSSGKITKENKKRLMNYVNAEHEMNVLSAQGKYNKDKIYYQYYYHGLNGRGYCFYRINNKKLELFNCGVYANHTEEKYKTPQTFYALSRLVDSIALNNITFRVNNDSLILIDSLNRRLIFTKTKVIYNQ